jgi:HEPN domain-containing protein
MPSGSSTESDRWFRQAERDIAAAAASGEAGAYDWACFQAQQAAEKAVKAVLFGRGYRKILTHSVYELVLEAAPHCSPLKSFTREAKDLDSVYITARYPNGISGSLIPADYYTKEDADTCLNSAGSILGAVRHCMKR